MQTLSLLLLESLAGRVVPGLADKLVSSPFLKSSAALPLEARLSVVESSARDGDLWEVAQDL
jgi:hypothetical protein